MNSKKIDNLMKFITLPLVVFFAVIGCIVIFEGVNHADDFELRDYNRIDSLTQVVDSLQRIHQTVQTQEDDSIAYYLNQLEKVIQLNKALDEAQPTQMVVTVNKMSDLRTYLYSGWRVKDVVSTPDSKINAVLER